MIQVVPASTTVIRYLIDLTDNLTHFCSCSQVVLTSYQDFALHFLSYLHRSQTFFSINCLSYQTSCLNFNIHKFKNIQSLKSTPTHVKVIKIFLYLNRAGIDHHTCGFLSYFSIEISETVLQLEKLSHQLFAML